MVSLSTQSQTIKTDISYKPDDLNPAMRRLKGIYFHNSMETDETV